MAELRARRCLTHIAFFEYVVVVVVEEEEEGMRKGWGRVGECHGHGHGDFIMKPRELRFNACSRLIRWLGRIPSRTGGI